MPGTAPGAAHTKVTEKNFLSPRGSLAFSGMDRMQTDKPSETQQWQAA